MTTYYISKYALTKGVYAVETEEPLFEGTLLTVYRQDSFFPEHYHNEGQDWHRTREAANAKAEQMRVKKIATLKKQITKLEATRFV